jgi:flavin reductase (DIM6/NTAB) family NADH-FMN oxidoreductase RutF
MNIAEPVKLINRPSNDRSGGFMKEKLGAKLALYPSLTVLAGSLVDKKPNFLPIAHVGIADMSTLTLSMNRSHHTNIGIKSNKTFSVNIPSEAMVKKTDYCGLVSGKRVDKSNIFKVFYGELETAPMIEECPINMECKLLQTIEMPEHELFVGKVVQTYVAKEYMSGKTVDIEKVKPLMFCMWDRGYYQLGAKIADAWSVGKEIKEKK